MDPDKLDWEGNVIPTSWSEDDQNRLALLRESGYTWPKVALMMGNSRTVDACKKAYQRIAKARQEAEQQGYGTEDEDESDDGDDNSGGGASAGAGAGAKGTRVHWNKQQYNKLISVCKDMEMKPNVQHHISVWRQVATRVGGNRSARACKVQWTKMNKPKTPSMGGRGWTPEEDAA